MCILVVLVALRGRLSADYVQLFRFSKLGVKLLLCAAVGYELVAQFFCRLCGAALRGAQWRTSTIAVGCSESEL